MRWGIACARLLAPRDFPGEAGTAILWILYVRFRPLTEACLAGFVPSDPPARLVSLISRDMTLLPGDVIACGTSLGVGSMKEPRNTVEVTIEGIGTLSNVFEQ